MNLTRKLAFGGKNFRQHMGIKDNLTLAGMLKRYTRKYPRAYAVLKGGTVLGGVYFMMMSLFPGTSMPLQKEIKLSIYAFSRFAVQMWYYNIITPEPQQYLIKLNEIALAVIDEHIFDMPFLATILGEVKTIVEEEKRAIKKDSFLDLLIYSEIILQNIIRYEKKMLLEKDLLAYYEWVYATVFAGLQTVTVTDKERKHLKLVYPLIQYLFNFADPQGKARSIHIYHQFATKCDVKKENHNSFRWKVLATALSQAPFKASLKQIYGQTDSPQLRQEILHIFQRLNMVYQHETLPS